MNIGGNLISTVPTAAVDSPVSSWIFTSRSIALRLFLTCWLVYSVHVATNTVREIYLALSIGDHLSFRVDDYANMHPDLFETPGRGWHIGANPGASMLAAVPYALSRPILDRIVANVNRRRAATGQTAPPQYDSPFPMRRAFYDEAWRRGYDVKFGLAAVVMQWFCMAPISALGVVAMFFLLRQVFQSDRIAFWLALLYGFGTPVFFRAGFINQNMIEGHIVLIGFLLLWNPGNAIRWQASTRLLLGGLAGGTAVLLDYTGLIPLLALFLYAVMGAWKARPERSWIRDGAQVVVGSLPPIFLLWFYQYQSFGNPFLPGQNWMPPVEWSDLGYQGFTLPQLDLLVHLLFDYRYGLFLTCPLMLLALLSWRCRRSGEERIQDRELAFLYFMPLGLLTFCACISYTRLQYNNGLRYLAPLLPFFFILSSMVLTRLHRRLAYLIALAAVAQAWSMSMARDVERGLGLLEPPLHVFIGGFQLPALTVFSRMSNGQYGDYAARGVSPLPLFALVGMVLAAVWWRPRQADRAAG